MKLAAPAKINLSLEIRGKREDGFHEIESLFCPISLCDELEIKEGKGLQFDCDDSTIPVNGDNLVVKAAELFFRKIGHDPNVTISLQKRIPHGAGLGGGSSDAATTLMGLNSQFDAGLTELELVELAMQIGSDVPFFLYRSPAWCSGRGEKVEEAVLNAAFPLLLIKPAFGVSTPWAYQKWKDSRELPEIPYAPQMLSFAKLVNDLERPVFEKYLFLAALKRWLLQQPEVEGALMSGSGSTLFAILHSSDAAQALAERLRAQWDEELWICLCNPLLNESDYTDPKALIF